MSQALTHLATLVVGLVTGWFAAMLAARNTRAARVEEERASYRREGAQVIASGMNVVDRALPFVLRGMRLEERQAYVEAGRQRWEQVKEPLLSLGYGHPIADVRERVLGVEVAIENALAAAAQAASFVVEGEPPPSGPIPTVHELLEQLQADPAALSRPSHLSREDAELVWLSVEAECHKAYEALEELRESLHTAS